MRASRMQRFAIARKWLCIGGSKKIAVRSARQIKDFRTSAKGRGKWGTRRKGGNGIGARASVSATIGRMCEGLPLQITIATAKRE
jgi:hypothetical protein